MLLFSMSIANSKFCYPFMHFRARLHISISSLSLHYYLCKRCVMHIVCLCKMVCWHMITSTYPHTHIEKHEDRLLWCIRGGAIYNNLDATFRICLLKLFYAWHDIGSSRIFNVCRYSRICHRSRRISTCHSERSMHSHQTYACSCFYRWWHFWTNNLIYEYFAVPRTKIERTWRLDAMQHWHKW